MRNQIGDQFGPVMVEDILLDHHSNKSKVVLRHVHTGAIVNISPIDLEKAKNSADVTAALLAFFPKRPEWFNSGQAWDKSIGVTDEEADQGEDQQER